MGKLVLMKGALQVCFVVYLCASKSDQLALNRPRIDPGVFAIQGITTCLQGEGYCLLGPSCSVDDDFEGTLDEEGQHCDGLRTAFNPTVNFTCCRPVTKTSYESSTEPDAAIPLDDKTTLPPETTQQNVIEIDLGGGEEEPGDKTKQNNLISQIGNAAANTNNILENLVSLKSELPDAELFPDSSSEDPQTTEFEFLENDKSLIGLLLAGLNESLKLEPNSEQRSL